MANKSSSKRFGFKRTNTSGGHDDPVTVTELIDMGGGGPSNSRGEPSMSKLADEFGGVVKPDHTEAIADISEAEANRKLKTFRDEHSWDPNMPDGAFDAVKSATEVHDGKTEAILVDELVNDSPYPEVRYVPLLVLSTGLD
jgi:hypothetical protein